MYSLFRDIRLINNSLAPLQKSATTHIKLDTYTGVAHMSRISDFLAYFSKNVAVFALVYSFDYV